MAKLTTQDYTVRRMLVKILDTVSPNLREIAREIGVSYGSLRAYRLGTRTPSPRVMRALIAAIRRRSVSLAKLATELEEAAKR